MSLFFNNFFFYHKINIYMCILKFIETNIPKINSRINFFIFTLKKILLAHVNFLVSSARKYDFSNN